MNQHAATGDEPRVVAIGDDDYSRAICDDHIRHLIMPGTNETLCSESVGAGWLVLPAAKNDRRVPSTCRLCATHRYWLPAAGELERDASLDLAIQPDAVVRRYVTGDDDPGRGRYHRPESLQICLTCAQIRGPFGSFDNLCSCDRKQWEGARQPRHGDISNSGHLCCTCTVSVVNSFTRWSSFHCEACQPATFGLRRRLVGNPIPLGWHSLTNGVGLSGRVAQNLEPAGWVAFHDQLMAQFSNQDRLFELRRRRTLDRLAMLGFGGHAVRHIDYLEACKQIGFGPRQGFEEFLAHVLGHPDPELAEELWNGGAPFGAAGKRERGDRSS